MLGNDPYVLESTVWHRRMHPVVHDFSYKVYYLAFNPRTSDTLERGPMRVNRRGLLSFRDGDYGARDGSACYRWAERVFEACQIPTHDCALALITMPRVLGYGFNPVSFWLLLEGKTTLRAVIAEVTNTFGESHSYVLAHEDNRPIASDDVLMASKHFHVSPFLATEGDYHFRFSIREHGLSVMIDHTDAEGNMKLKTSLRGNLRPYTTMRIWRMFIRYPLVPLKVVALIHYHALRLWLKKVRYIRKPTPPNFEVTPWHS